VGRALCPPFDVGRALRPTCLAGGRKASPPSLPRITLLVCRLRAKPAPSVFVRPRSMRERG
jgi:hypothetical protein